VEAASNDCKILMTIKSPTQYCQALPATWRRVVAFGVVPLAIALVICGAIVPMQALYESQVEWRSQAYRTVSLARGSRQALAGVADQLQALPAAPIWTKFYAAETPGGGIAMLQADVSVLLDAARVGTQSLIPLRTETQQELPTIGVRLSASMTIEQLRSLLGSLAAHSRFLSIRHLSVSAPLVQDAQENAMLTVGMDIVGIERTVEATGGGGV
jgi:hypothetical protein